MKYLLCIRQYATEMRIKPVFEVMFVGRSICVLYVKPHFASVELLNAYRDVSIGDVHVIISV